MRSVPRGTDSGPMVLVGAGKFQPMSSATHHLRTDSHVEPSQSVGSLAGSTARTSRSPSATFSTKPPVDITYNTC